MIRALLFAAAVVGGLLAALPGHAQSPLKIGVSAGPYGDILRHAADIAAKEGLKAEIIEFTEWTVINEALNNGDLDANNFQHKPYLNNQIAQRGYKLEPIAPSIVVPMGVYSSKVKTLADLPKGATVGIPNDPTNSSRALFLLQQAGLLTLRDGVGLDATQADIVTNPKNIRLQELDAAQLPRSLTDLDAATITLNYAVLAKLDPKHALVLEDEKTLWHIVWVTRTDRAADPRIKRFVEIYRSAEVKDFIAKTFDGTIVATW